MLKRVLAAGSIVAFVLTLTGCNYSSNNPPPVQVRQRLLVGNFASGGTTSTIVAYTYPLNASSVPSSTIPGSAGGPNGTTGLIEDGVGDLFVANQDSNNVLGYFPIVGNASVPAITMVNGIHSPQDLTFDSGFNLYVANFTTTLNPAGTISVFTPPLANSSIPAATVVNGINGPTSVTFNGAGSIFVANKTGGNVTTYLLPVSAASTPAVTLSNGLVAPVAVAFDRSGALYIADNANNAVDVYTGVLTGNPAPNFAIVNGISAPRYLTFDVGGFLYVSNASSITVYQPPLSAGSSPFLTITTGLNHPVGEVVGI
jgi:hypothetical protein